jgi:hypothetical protein
VKELVRYLLDNIQIDFQGGIDLDTMREFLRYEPDTGALTWLPRDPKWFTDDRYCKGWNTRYAGTPAAAADPNGYIHVSFYGRAFLAHRVIWAMVHGEWPDEIDHIDGDPSNNRLNNLRSVGRLENTRNKKRYKNNNSGHQGIVHLPKRGTTPERWEAYIGRTYLGRFFSCEEATEARRAAALEAGFHENHGARS